MPGDVQGHPGDTGIGLPEFATFGQCGAGVAPGKGEMGDPGNTGWQEVQRVVVLGEVQEGSMAAVPCPVGAEGG